MSEAMVLDFASPVAASRESTRTGSTSLSLSIVGLNHRTAPVAVRERLAGLEPLEGACVLSTCNRVEVIISSADENVVDSVIDWMASHADTSREDLEPHLYLLRDTDAIEHLFRVTSGLDSMIVGEPQIAGQVKRAFTAVPLDPLLHQVYEQTMRVSKKVRTETGIGEHAVSIPFAAIELAKKIFGDLTGLRVLLLGAGEMGELTAEHLAGQQVRQIFVANKTYQRAVELAERFHGTAVQFGALEDHLAECDIVIASTSAPHFVIGREQVQRALDARNQRGLFLIDLSVPRNVDPSIQNIDGAYLYNVDDLQQVATANLDLRRSKVADAEAIIAREVECFRRRLREQEAAPTIRELQSRVDAIRTAEVEKCLRKLGPITDHQRATIEQVTLQMINKILHHPIVQLREDDSMRPTIRKVFGLA
jgi:glutamyl-tRNA reductase